MTAQANTVYISFNGKHIATVDNIPEAIKGAIRDHIGTWAGNGVTAKIIGSRPVVALGATGQIIEVESRRGVVYVVEVYRICTGMK